MIVSPWITMKVVEGEGLVTLVKDAVEKRGVRVRIVVDGELSTSLPSRGGIAAISEMRKAGAAVDLARGLHCKTLIINTTEIIEGSFNWLSANRGPDDRHVRHDASWRISGEGALPAIRAALKEFDELSEEHGQFRPERCAREEAMIPLRQSRQRVVG